MPEPLTPTDAFEGWALDPLVEELLHAAELERDGKTARTLVKSGPLTVVLTVMRSGHHLVEHAAPGPVMVVPVRGEVVFRRGSTTTRSVGGAQMHALTMGPGVRHAVEAREDSAFLLIIGARAHAG